MSLPWQEQISKLRILKSVLQELHIRLQKLSGKDSLGPVYFIAEFAAPVIFPTFGACTFWHQTILTPIRFAPIHLEARPYNTGYFCASLIGRWSF